MIYIISDLHGCFYTLQKLIEKIRKQDKSPQFVFVGDYVDRGLHSKECVEFVIQLQSEGAVCLRGNHDDVIDWLIHKESVTDMREFIPSGIELNRVNIGSWWLVNGLFQTIQSYVDMQLQLGENPLDFILQMFINSIPVEHKNFFRNLKMHWENDTHFAAHAYLDPTKTLPRTLKFLPSVMNHEMLWSRFPVNQVDIQSYGQSSPAGVGCSLPVWDKIGVFGHTPMHSYGGLDPIRHGNLRLIDTGAFMGRSLCAYIVEQDDHILQATDSRDISSY